MKSINIKSINIKPAFLGALGFTALYLSACTFANTTLDPSRNENVGTTVQTTATNRAIDILDDTADRIMKSNALIVGSFIRYNADKAAAIPFLDALLLWESHTKDLENQFADAFAANGRVNANQYAAIEAKYLALAKDIRDNLLTISPITDSTNPIIPPEADRMLKDNQFLENTPLLMPKHKFEALDNADKNDYLHELRLDILSHYQNILLFLANTQEKLSLRYPNFKIVADIPKASIVLGEELAINFYLGDTDNSDLTLNSLTVNGGGLDIRKKIIYSTRPRRIGEQRYTVQASFTDNNTGEIIKQEQEFFFDVVAPQFGLATAENSILYIGEENIISIEQAGISINDLGISIKGTANASLNRINNYSSVVKPARQGTVQLTLTDKKSGNLLGVFNYTAKARS